MKNTSPAVPSTLILLGTILLLDCGAVYAGPVMPGYESATYHGRKFGIGINYDVQMRWQPHDAAVPSWMQLPAHSDAQTRVLTPDLPWVHVVLSYRVLGVRSTTDTLLELENGLAIQRIVRRPRGDQVRYKATQFGVSGIRVLRTRNAGELDSVDWTQARSEYFPYPPWFGDGVAISDPSALFYVLSRDDLRLPGDSLQMPIFSKEHLILLELTVEGLVTSMVSYVERSKTAERRVKEERAAILIRVHARHLDPNPEEEDMEVLGMKGDLEILLDASRRLPLRISGKAPIVGTVNLHLKGVDLSQ